MSYTSVGKFYSTPPPQRGGGVEEGDTAFLPPPWVGFTLLSWGPANMPPSVGGGGKGGGVCSNVISTKPLCGAWRNLIHIKTKVEISRLRSK